MSEEFPIGIEYLEKKNKKSGAVIRKGFRVAKVKKNGKAYCWKTKGEADKEYAKAFNKTREAA